jgi:transposase
LPEILLASARGERAPHIATSLGCGSQTVRNAIHDFDKEGLEALRPGSSRPERIHFAFDGPKAEDLREMLHHYSPRELGKESSLWTLEMAAAEVSFERGLTRERASGETVRATLARLGVRWMRAKKWISSPDPHYAARKKGLATG